MSHPNSTPSTSPAARAGRALRRRIQEVQAGAEPSRLLLAVRPHVRKALGKGTPRDEVDTLSSDFALGCAGPGGPDLTRALLGHPDDQLPQALAALVPELRARRAAIPDSPARFALVGEQGLPLDARLRFFASADRAIHLLRRELTPLQFALVGLSWRGLDEAQANARLGLDAGQAAHERALAEEALERFRTHHRLG
ncbi:MAG: hypothetical protein FJ086_11865 [Deltaproteobacteria bacterium]|nr:hypothetical protein [Deltaproteobacteria bacterium]